MSSPIAIYIVAREGFVWFPQDVLHLRRQYRIAGTLIGCHPTHYNQNLHLGLPLCLSADEITLLLEKGAVRLLDASTPLPAPTKEEIQQQEDQRENCYLEQVELGRELRVKSALRYKEQIEKGKKEKGEQRRLKKLKATQNADQKNLTLNGTSGAEDAEILSSPSGNSVPVRNSDHVPASSTECNVKSGGGPTENQFDIEKFTESLRQRQPLPRKHSLVQIRTADQNHTTQLATAAWSYPTSDTEVLRYSVFKDLWENGYFITDGAKFGGDFLVYPGDPVQFHAHHIALCWPSNQPISKCELARMCRNGTSVKKTFILCSLDHDDHVTYTALTHHKQT